MTNLEEEAQSKDQIKLGYFLNTPLKWKYMLKSVLSVSLWEELDTLPLKLAKFQNRWVWVGNELRGSPSKL